MSEETSLEAAVQAGRRAGMAMLAVWEQKGFYGGGREKYESICDAAARGAWEVTTKGADSNKRPPSGDQVVVTPEGRAFVYDKGKDHMGWLDVDMKGLPAALQKTAEALHDLASAVQWREA